VVVGIITMILGELYLSISLRGDEGNIGGHKKRGIGELLKQEKKYSCLQYDSFMGIGEVLRNCWRCSNYHFYLRSM
jgi:hypothetical protein